jgi:hypothetical protein
MGAPWNMIRRLQATESASGRSAIAPEVPMPGRRLIDC